MAALNGLVPARFLTIIAHMVLVIVIFWSRGDNVKACLPRIYSDAEYEKKDTQLIIGLSVSLGLFVLELVGFMGGLSMFMPSQGLLSTAAHASAAFTLVLFLFDQWCSDSFWYVFAFGSALPGIMEIIVIIGVVTMKMGM